MSGYILQVYSKILHPEHRKHFLTKNGQHTTGEASISKEYLRAGSMAEVAEQLPSKCYALSSSSNTDKRKKERKYI
jgi:hypothetical protein